MNNEKPLTKNELLEALKPFATKADFSEFATKSDLIHVVTKDDLTHFATKYDLAHFATKDDIAHFATKDDLLKFATKDDLLKFATKEDLLRFATKDDLLKFATKDDLAHFATKETLIKELQMVRNEFKDELFKTRIALENKIDSVHEELESDINRLAKMCAQEFLVTQNNERRIGILEKNVLV